MEKNMKKIYICITGKKKDLNYDWPWGKHITNWEMLLKSDTSSWLRIRARKGLLWLLEAMGRGSPSSVDQGPPPQTAVVLQSFALEVWNAELCCRLALTEPSYDYESKNGQTKQQLHASQGSFRGARVCVVISRMGDRHCRAVTHRGETACPQW